MASYIAIFLSLVSVILLTIILIRFKKLFSTEAIIEKTRLQMNKMIADINNNANRDMELINDCSKRVRALLNESEQKMELYKQAAERLQQMIAIAEKMDEENGYTRVVVENKNVSNIKSVGQRKNDIISQLYGASPKKQSDIYVEKKNSKMQQEFLFEDDSEKSAVSQNKQASNNSFENSFTNSNESPLVITKIFEEQPVINKTQKASKNLSENIRILFNQGLDVEEIAKELSCSITEVQFIIDMLQ